MVGKIRWIALVMLLCMLISVSSARIGYDIVASAGGQAFELHRSTQYMNFSMDGSIKGSGKFSKLTSITRFAGVEAKEQTSSSKNSSLDYNEQLRLLSREGPVAATVNLQSVNLTDESNDNNNTSIIIKGSGNVEVDEIWPTYLADHKKISYLGPGMRSNERYKNNGDIVSTYIDSWKLSKESIYRTYINRSIISANITPRSIEVMRYTNRSSDYALSLDTVGASTRLDVAQRSLNNPIAQISQDYVGNQKMNLRIGMSDTVIREKWDDGWLPCCSSYDANAESVPGAASRIADG